MGGVCIEYRYGFFGAQCYGGDIVEEGRVNDFPLVGSNREPTNEFCNVFSRNLGCLAEHRHVGLDVPKEFLGDKGLDGKFGSGKAVIFVRAMHCYDPLCPVCAYGWAKREAKRALMRLDVFRGCYGDLYRDVHVTVSVPEFDWDKPYLWLKRQVAAFVCAVGVVGSLMMFHPKRYNKEAKIWYFSPHFHFYGFALGGRVDGGLVKFVHNLSGYVLKNLDERKSAVGTIMYQLSHAGVPEGRSHVVTWVGELNYRKSVHPDLLELLRLNEAQAKLENKHRACPVCGSKMLHVCRVAGVQDHFKYELFEERYVVEPVSNWCVVSEEVKRGKG